VDGGRHGDHGSRNHWSAFVKLEAVIELLAADVLHADAGHLQMEIATAAASDLMSDILARQATPDLMVTGLATLQAIRTASVASVKAVMIARGKTVTAPMVELAKDCDIPLMVTGHSLFTAAGRLWEGGIRSGLDPA
jgi:predicted transcriptional regulator